MRTLRLSLVGTVILGLLGGLGGVVTAQDEPLAPMRASHFTGTWSEQISGVGPDQLVWTPGPGYGESLGNEWVGIFDASDPRISGTWTSVQDLRAFPIDVAANDHAVVWTSAVRIENEDGAWSGTLDGYNNGSLAREWNRLTGEGAYEGLTAIFRWIEEGDAYEGVIIPGDMPDYPAVIAASAGEAAGEATAQAGQESTVEPTAWTEATVEVLSDVGVIPLEAIPEDADHVTYARVFVEPGVSGEVGSGQPQRWASLEYVVAGASSATIAERSRIWRADGTIEDIPAGVAGTASTGDTILTYDGAAAMAFENGPDEYVSFLVLPGNSRDQADPQVSPSGAEWRLLDYIFPLGATADAWFSAPIAVSYQRITWEPGAQLVLGPDEVPMLSFIWLERGTLKSGELALEEVSGAELSGTVPTGWTYRQETPPDGTVYLLRNEGDEPAVGIAAVLSHPSEA